MLLSATLLILTIILGAIPLLLTKRFRLHLSRYSSTPATSAASPTALILPCKGLDPGFQENIHAILGQDHPSLELVFVVATRDDPAYAALQELLTESAAAGANVPWKLIVAGVSNKRAQKLTNQLAALASVSTHVDTIVFLDSDIRPDPGFVRRLVHPLAVAGVGATTGFRWYHPPSPTLGSILRSAWNAGALPFVADPDRNFAWGGAMAIRRATFEAAGIADAWENAVSDDFPFTIGVRRMQLELRFVPECVAVSYEASSLCQTLEFTNRQSVISRVYFPPLWWSAAIGHSFANLLPLFGLYSLVMWLVEGSADDLLGIGCLILVPLQMANAAYLFSEARGLLPQLGDALQKLRWRYVLTAPLASILSLVNTLYSATTRQIHWRGVRYELCSPANTKVLGPAGDSWPGARHG